MKNGLSLLAMTAIMGFSVASHAADPHAKVESSVDYKNNGGYESNVTSEEVNAAGTARTSEKSVDVDVDRNGNVVSTIDTEKTVDPKGLMNKKTTSTSTKAVNGKVIEMEKKGN
jgi:hypothetical protein